MIDFLWYASLYFGTGFVLTLLSLILSGLRASFCQLLGTVLIGTAFWPVLFVLMSVRDMSQWDD